MYQSPFFQINLLSANGSTAEAYLIAPFDCIVQNVIATLQGDPGDSDVITVTELGDSTTLGTITFGTTLAVGDDQVSYVKDTTNGDHKVLAGETIRFQLSAATAAANIHLNVELDPFCLPA